MKWEINTLRRKNIGVRVGSRQSTTRASFEEAENQ